jgi:hypothetical protein
VAPVFNGGAVYGGNLGQDPGTPGLGAGAATCPDCNITMTAGGQVDNEITGVDSWYVSTKDSKGQAAAPGCAVQDDPAPAGQPTNTYNDAGIGTESVGLGGSPSGAAENGCGRRAASGSGAGIDCYHMSSTVTVRRFAGGPRTGMAGCGLGVVGLPAPAMRNRVPGRSASQRAVHLGLHGRGSSGFVRAGGAP